MENSMEAMEVPTPGHVSGENHGLKGYRQVFIEALFSQDIGATWASIVRGMDKGDVVHIYNGILRSHEKEWTKATCSNMDGPRECHTGIFKMDNQQRPTVQHMELCSVLCGSLDGRGVWGRWTHEYAWLSPFVVPLKWLQHCQLARLQYKIKSSKWKKKWSHKCKVKNKIFKKIVKTLEIIDI